MSFSKSLSRLGASYNPANPTQLERKEFVTKVTIDKMAADLFGFDEPAPTSVDD